MTIRLRLSLWYGLVIAATIALVAAIVWWRFAIDMRATMQEALAVQVADATAAMDAGGGDALREDPARPGIFTMVLDPSGAVIARSRTAPADIGQVPLGGSTWRPPGSTSDIALYAGVAAGGRRVVAGSSLARTQDELDRLAGQLLLVGGIAAAGSLAGGWWLARRALAPVGRLVDEADRIHGSAGSLRRRLHDPDTGDELGRLASTFNRMLDRVERSLVRQRAFVASASHDLRTPIAALRVELELALRPGATKEELRAAVEDALGDVGRLGRLADDLLGLAAVEESGREVSAESVQLAELASVVAGRATTAEPGRGVAVDLQVEDAAIVTDRVRLEQALSNLVANAVRHSPQDGVVTVRARLATDGEPRDAARRILEVDVLDRGPGVAAALTGILFVPFARSPDAGGGPGLGLATADAAVRALGGRIGYRPRPDGGAWFWFRIPAAEPA